MEKVTIYSDGGADPNPGYGGWAAILRFGRHEKVLTGSEPDTTNNRMELQAAIAALGALTRPSSILHRFAYLRRGIGEWIEGWAKRGWKSEEAGPLPTSISETALGAGSGARDRMAPGLAATVSTSWWTSWRVGPAGDHAGSDYWR